MIYPSFFSLGSATEIAQTVEKQLARYYYTFPTAHRVYIFLFFYFLVYTDWVLLDWLTQRASKAHTSLFQHLDYFSDKRVVFWSRNCLICISVWRVCFFFSLMQWVLQLKYTYSHFLTHMGDDGIVRWEVPILMVALVATVVSAAVSV